MDDADALPLECASFAVPARRALDDLSFHHSVWRLASPFASRQSAMIYRQIRALACIATASAFSLHAPALPAAPINAAASRPAVAAPQMNA